MEVRIDGDDSGGVVSLVANEVAANQVDGAVWKTDERDKLLVQPVRDRLESQRALSQDHSAGVDAYDGVHISCNIELRERLDASLGSILDVLLRFFELLSQLNA